MDEDVKKGGEAPGFLFTNLTIGPLLGLNVGVNEFSFLYRAIFPARSGLDDRGVRVPRPCLKMHAFN